MKDELTINVYKTFNKLISITYLIKLMMCYAQKS